MSAAIAMAPSPAPHDRPAYNTTSGGSKSDRHDLPPTPAANSATASAHSQTAAPPTSSPSAHRTPAAAAAARTSSLRSRSGSPSSRLAAKPAPKSSPSTSRHVSGGHGQTPKIIVKKEPGSPEMSATTTNANKPAPSARHRPRKLDLSKGAITGSGAATARPALGGREGLGIQEGALACLSPGFITHDPIMRDNVDRSNDVREQQRRIIEARLQQSANQNGSGHGKDKDSAGQFAKTPGISSRRNKAPAGLSIVAPAAEQFANERVIQSAPLGQTFTGRHPQPLSRHLANQPPNVSGSSHVHHMPAQQTANRLPPISDVFSQQGMPSHHDSNRSNLHPGQSHAPLPSPGHPPQNHHAQTSQPPLSARQREYKSAEEAQQELAGGRSDLLPRIVHYTGHQPPTPPSPRNTSAMHEGDRSASKRRRAEYEEGNTPPLGHGPSATRRGPFGAGRDSPESQRQKRTRFLQLCEEAWDLFHS